MKRLTLPLVLTLGLAVHRSGLAERLAVYLIRFAGGSPKLLYVQMLAAFAGLTFALPSASTRGASIRPSALRSS